MLSRFTVARFDQLTGLFLDLTHTTEELHRVVHCVLENWFPDPHFFCGDVAL